MDTGTGSDHLTGRREGDRAAGIVKVAETPGGVSIALRGTGTASLAKSRYPRRVTSRTLYPETRSEGNGQYLAQLLRTCIPLAGGDLAVLILSILFCAGIGMTWHLNDEAPINTIALWLTPTAVGLLMLNTVVGLYPGVRLGLVEEIRRLSMSLGTLLVISAGRLSMSSDFWVDRIMFSFATFALCMLFMPLMRSRVRAALAKQPWWGFPTLVCGNDAAVVSVYQWLRENQRLGLKPIGVITDPEGLEVDRDTPGYVGSWADARAVAERRQAYWAVMVEPANSEVEATSLVEQHLGIIPHVFVVSELTGMPDHWNRHQMDEGLEGLLVEQHLLLPVQQLVKRTMDLVISAIAGMFLVPLFLVLGLAIKITSPGPIFYGHTRVGKGNKRFKAWKFRTMCLNADKMIDEYLEQHPEHRAEWERDHKLKNDPRVTALGKWMRKWSVDELPQVWNVVSGDMSVVGPRPIVDAEICKYGEHFETFCTVLPGITGLWQVCGRNDTTYEERVQLDIYYIHHWSPWLDLYLLARTVKTVLFTRGAY